MFTGQMALLFNINIETVYILIARPNSAEPGKKNMFLHKKFLSTRYINEQDTFFLDCKHKRMIESGAPPDKVGVLHHLLTIEFHDFTSRIDF